MSELIFLYCAFMYLFAGGYVCAIVKLDLNLETYDKVMLLICAILAPIVMPMILGIIHGQDNF